MNTLYLVCFFLGLGLSLVAAFAGGGRLHLGHLHLGHLHLGRLHVGHTGHLGQTPGTPQVRASAGSPASPVAGLSAINGFTLPAFLCCFGAAGYLLLNYSPLLAALVVVLALAGGLFGAALIYLLLFRLLLPRERVLRAEDTRMEGTVARISGPLLGGGSVGEILFTQTGALRGSPARSEDGLPIPRGTEVVVLRYERGVAYVRPLGESPSGFPSGFSSDPAHTLNLHS